MKKIAVIFGCRPEVIKLFPVIKELKKHFEVGVIATGQHTNLLEQMLSNFNIKVNENLKVMVKSQSLSALTFKLHKQLAKVLAKRKPELVIVQGDTTSAMVATLEAYYHKIPVAHIEAGLRTNDIYQPFPEEINRRIISQIATYNFAPTQRAADNLKKENVLGDIVITGNTGIDTLLEVASTVNVEPKKQVLVTLHRRENFGKPLQNIINGLLAFLSQCPDWRIIFPVHPNPTVRAIVSVTLKNHPQIDLIEPLDYFEMVKKMKECLFIVTDSGGIQEEVPSLNRPVLVTREKTERPEGIEVGCAFLVGTNSDIIAQYAIKLATEPDFYKSMINKGNPYGDGQASIRIANYLLKI